MQNSVAKSARNIPIDFIRILLTIAVVVTHASGTLYKGGIGNGNVAVDGFFMIAGLFMARHVEKSRPVFGSKSELFFSYQKRRVVQLFPMYALTCILWCAIEVFRHHSFPWKNWPALYFFGDLNGIPGFLLTWFVSALFWGGVIVSALLVWKREISVLVIFPLAFFFGFAYLYKFQNLFLTFCPLIAGFISVNFIKALVGLCVGVELYFASEYTKKNLHLFKPRFVSFCVLCAELLFAACYVHTYQISFDVFDFFVYLYMPLILVSYSVHEPVILRFTKFKIFAFLAKPCYAVYLLHFPIIKFFEKTNLLSNVPHLAAFSVVVVLSFAVGFAAQYAVGNVKKLNYY